MKAVIPNEQEATEQHNQAAREYLRYKLPRWILMIAIILAFEGAIQLRNYFGESRLRLETSCYPSERSQCLEKNGEQSIIAPVKEGSQRVLSGY